MLQAYAYGRNFVLHQNPMTPLPPDLARTVKGSLDQIKIEEHYKQVLLQLTKMFCDLHETRGLKT
jgi:hypothetical protein